MLPLLWYCFSMGQLGPQFQVTYFFTSIQHFAVQRPLPHTIGLHFDQEPAWERPLTLSMFERYSGVAARKGDQPLVMFRLKGRRGL
mmetsp:Transcript_40475/g.67593  ORF Transcript_40475/g.67593 Transcript_40475/m.67593 type:complete len:86 (-) Transcript_40475:193-450(-)